MTTNQTIDGVPRELVRENIAYLRGMGGTYSEKSALAAKFEALLLEPEPAKDLREQYEAWADANGYDITRNDHGDYAGLVEDSMWTGWQARSEQRALLDAPAKPVPACIGELERFESDGEDFVKVGDVIDMLGDMKAAKPLGEPVAWIKPDVAKTLTKDECCYAFGSQNPKGTLIPLYAEQPAPVAVVMPERSNQDYAIEHAEYMAQSADEVLAKFQAYGLALLAVDEGGDDGEDELFENIDSARGDLQESLVGLRSMVYEFRKRSAKTR